MSENSNAAAKKQLQALAAKTQLQALVTSLYKSSICGPRILSIPNQERILYAFIDILERHPSLCLERFSTTKTEEEVLAHQALPHICRQKHFQLLKATPLALMLNSMSSDTSSDTSSFVLEHIKTLVNINVEQLLIYNKGTLRESEIDVLAIHVALHNEIGLDIVHHLAKSCPSSLVDQKKSVTSIETLLTSYKTPYNGRGKLLKKLLDNDFPQEVIQYIAHATVNPEDESLDIVHSFDDNIQFPKNLALAISRHIVNLSLSLSETDWNTTGLVYFFNAFEDNKSIRKLDVFFKEVDKLSSNAQNALVALGNLIKKNNTIETLSFDLSESICFWESDDLIRSIVKGMEYNQTIRELHMDYFYSSLSPLLDLLCVAPKELSLVSFDVQAYNIEDQTVFFQRESSLNTLLLSHNELHRASIYNHILRKIAEFPHLEFVQGTDNSDGEELIDHDITDGANYLLQVNKSLKSLDMSDSGVISLKGICKGLGQNRTLQSLRFDSLDSLDDVKEGMSELLKALIESGNTSLKEVTYNLLRDVETHYTALKTYQGERADWFDSATPEDDEVLGLLDDQMGWFLGLNKWGRKTARDPNVSLPVFVGLLCAVVDEQGKTVTRQFPSHHSVELDKFNMLHGILGESPRVWAGPNMKVAGAKRKRIWMDRELAAPEGV